VDLTTALLLAGIVVGLVYGALGVGSAFATPLLSLLGVPPLTAVVGPLPALLPGSAAGAWSHARDGHVDWRVARAAVLGALPAAILGAIASRHVGGPVLLVLSGVVLLVAGLRVLFPGTPLPEDVAARRRGRVGTVAAAAAAVGFASGLLANGGGFLLVPLFLLALGLDVRRASGTSLVVATALTVPTLVTHSVMGSIDWAVAATFAAGLVPGVLVGGRIARRVPAHRARVALGVVLVVVAVMSLLRQVPGLAA
jgi:uncharacterized membrane protein YfcA